jgi:hypothetical protein
MVEKAVLTKTFFFATNIKQIDECSLPSKVVVFVIWQPIGKKSVRRTKETFNKNSYSD